MLYWQAVFLKRIQCLRDLVLPTLNSQKNFTKSIESKVTAVQNAEAAKNKLEQVKFEAQQTIETAKSPG